LRDLEHFGRGGDDRAEHVAAARRFEPAVLGLDLVEVEGAATIRPSSSMSTGLR
jgi:hypothetical protein